MRLTSEYGYQEEINGNYINKLQCSHKQTVVALNNEERLTRLQVINTSMKVLDTEKSTGCSRP